MEEMYWIKYRLVIRHYCGRLGPDMKKCLNLNFLTHIWFLAIERAQKMQETHYSYLFIDLKNPMHIALGG